MGCGILHLDSRIPATGRCGKIGEHGKFVTASLGIALAMVLTSSCQPLKIEIDSDDYENILDGFKQLAIVALAVYIVMFRFRDSELDLGYLFKVTQAKSRV